ncbi:MAG TPA: M48 family metallopeptidase [Dokdonella sp.]|uniref:M48 family metallopeptidase n=1 Tax=Dokdonella sp. TaxID=2291710 RepID=UPI0025BC4E7F|nr:M48 family metallopeptidase [Dokdonella sp.]MBX3692241.1 M48 family metallopeptidase [Dokdonella sp.]MCW5567690.1 M48 family metallopeptidase [Dokdonella sp.]HNR90920.1 M48 family metallopeptidase [Dokdonella sp.]
MSYENPPVPHEVNVTRENPLGEFLRLLIGLGLVTAFAAATLWAGGGWLARHLPFASEAALVGESVPGLELVAADEGTAVPAAIVAYVDDLTTRLAAAMDLPDGMQVRMHVVDSGVANAFATLGGHIVITRELYSRMPSENALAFVIAHEIAHVRERDPIAAVGGGASIALAFALLGGDASRLLPQVAHLVTLGYSRAVETRADGLALAALKAVYGHAADADAAIRALADAREAAATATPPTLLSTHPADAERIARLASAASAGADAVIAPLRVAWTGD